MTLLTADRHKLPVKRPKVPASVDISPAFHVPLAKLGCMIFDIKLIPLPSRMTVHIKTRVPPRKYIQIGLPPHISSAQPTAVMNKVTAFRPLSLTWSEICPTIVLTGMTVSPKTANIRPASDEVQPYSLPVKTGKLSRYACCTSFSKKRMQKVAIMGCTVLCQDGTIGSDFAGFTGELIDEVSAALPLSSWPGVLDSKGCVSVDSGMLSLLWSSASALQHHQLNTQRLPSLLFVDQDKCRNRVAVQNHTMSCDSDDSDMTQRT